MAAKLRSTQMFRLEASGAPEFLKKAGAVGFSRATSAISPNRADRLNTTMGVLQLDYTGTANVRQLWINGVQQADDV